MACDHYCPLSLFSLLLTNRPTFWPALLSPYLTVTTQPQVHKTAELSLGAKLSIFTLQPLLPTYLLGFNTLFGYSNICKHYCWQVVKSSILYDVSGVGHICVLVTTSVSSAPTAPHISITNYTLLISREQITSFIHFHLVFSPFIAIPCFSFSMLL